MKTFKDFGIIIGENATENVKVICPKCSSERKKTKEPCLSVHVEKGVWNCHNCGWSGSLGSGTYVQPEKKYNKPEPYITDLPDNVVKWFETRGISKVTLEAERIGYGEAWMPAEERYMNCIIFPYYKNGELVNCKFRDGKKNFSQVAGAEKTWFRFDSVKTAKEILIVEGEMDALSWVETGVKCVVSVPDGAPNPNAKNVDNKLNFINDLEIKDQTIFINTDNDEPGRRLQEELIKRFGADRCRIVALPDDCKDANECLMKHGKNVLLDCVIKAKYVQVDGIFTPIQFTNNMMDVLKHGYTRGVSTGWASLDEYYTVMKKTFTVVTGTPGAGKSTFMDGLTYNMVKNRGWKIAFFTPEKRPIERHLTKIAELYYGKVYWVLSESEVLAFTRWAGDYYSFIQPPDNCTIDNILDLSRTIATRSGLDAVVIDPYNRIEHRRPAGMTANEFVSQLLTKVDNFAKKYNVHVWIVAHPTKMKKKESGDYDVPTLYDVSDSAHWFNMPDAGLSVYRYYSSEQNPEIYITKVRDELIGKLGSVPFKFKEGKFYEN